MSTLVLGSNTYQVVPNVNGDPLTVSESGTIPSLIGGSGPPGGAPTYGTGSVYYDVTNYISYIYEGGSWQEITISNVVNSVIAGSGISVSGATGNVTIGNTGVLSNIAGTNITVSGATGNVTINTTLNPSFNTVTSTVATGTAPFTVSSTTQVANLNSATSGLATNSSNTLVTTSSSNTNFPIVFSPTAVTGQQSLLMNSGLTYNPSSGVLAMAVADTITIGTLGYVRANTLISAATSINGSNQIIIQNTNSGSSASSNFIVSNDIGTASTFLGDFGMNSSGVTGAGSLHQPSYVYLTSTSSDLTLGTTTSNGIHFVINDGVTDAFSIGTSGQWLIAGSAGLSGQIFTSNGSGAAPSWTSLSSSAVTSFSAGTTGFTPNSATTGAITLAGTLNIANGGTGQTTASTAFNALSPLTTKGDIQTYSTTNTRLGVGTNGQILAADSAQTTGLLWTTLSTVAVTTFSAGTTGFTPNSATSGAVTLAGTLATANGGTGLSTIGTANQILGVNAGATALEYKTVTPTTNQTFVTQGVGSVTIGIADNAILPGTASVTLPTGTTAQRPGSPTDGMLRFNTDLEILEGYANRYSIFQSPVAIQNTLTAPRRRSWVDEFTTGGITLNTTGAIGVLGWSTNSTGGGSSISYVTAVAAHPGIINIQGGAGNSATIRVFFGAADADGVILANQVQQMTWIVRIPTASTDSFLFGMGQTINSATFGTDSVYFIFSPANANWQFVTRAASTSTTVTTTQAVTAATWYQLEMFYDGTTWTPVINGTKNTASSTNVPTSAVNVGCAVINPGAGAAQRSIDLDFFSMISIELAQRY